MAVLAAGLALTAAGPAAAVPLAPPALADDDRTDAEPPALDRGVPDTAAAIGDDAEAMLDVAPDELPAEVAQRQGLELPADRCAGPAPSLSSALDALAQALPEAPSPAPDADQAVPEEAREPLARLVSCVAEHAGDLPDVDQRPVPPITNRTPIDEEALEPWRNPAERLRLLQATRDLARAADRATDALDSCLADGSCTIPTSSEPTCMLNCLVQTGDAGPTNYTEEAVVILDEGGDDTYRNNAGGGTITPAVLVDRGQGEDRYEPPSQYYNEATIGSGMLGGVGVLLDEGGDDVYRGLSHSMGVGFVAAAGFLWDKGGDDAYRSFPHPDGEDSDGQSNKVVIGAASYGSVAFLVDEGGDDERVQYGVDAIGYGAAGAVGILRDDTGNDTYTAHPDWTGSTAEGGPWLHTGISIGAGEVGGGVGILLDGGGDDAYACTGRINYGCVGGADIAGVGVLYDADGDDAYSIPDYIYPHGKLDNGGLGSAGAGSLAALIDRAGADTYTSEATGAGGVGRVGAAGLFVDHGGYDDYELPGPTGAAVALGAGASPEDRGNDRVWTDDGYTEHFGEPCVDAPDALPPLDTGPLSVSPPDPTCPVTLANGQLTGIGVDLPAGFAP